MNRWKYKQNSDIFYNMVNFDILLSEMYSQKSTYISWFVVGT